MENFVAHELLESVGRCGIRENVRHSAAVKSIQQRIDKRSCRKPNSKAHSRKWFKNTSKQGGDDVILPFNKRIFIRYSMQYTRTFIMRYLQQAAYTHTHTPTHIQLSTHKSTNTCTYSPCIYQCSARRRSMCEAR